MIKPRWPYLLALVLTLILGLLSRSALNPSVFLLEHAGDALWALAVYWGFAVLFPAGSITRLAFCALSFAFVVEFSQLFQTPFLLELRSNKLGALVLGHGFLWEDLVRYTVGVLLGMGLDRLWRRQKREIQS